MLKDKIQLNEGETLKPDGHRTKGPQAETDIYTYIVLNSNGDHIGTVIHTDHTALRGFRRTQTVERRDSSGKLIADARW